MKNWKWYLTIVLVLILSSALFYLIQIIIFHKTGDTFFYMLQDISFVPIQVLFVTFVLDRLMKKREKDSFLNKLNMIIGVFYNDIGVDFIKLCNNFIQDIAETGRHLTISAKWSDKEFNNAINIISISPKQFNLSHITITQVNTLLIQKKDNLLSMLENPNLLEHESFTDLLWAMFHLSDELSHRKIFYNLPQADIDHLKVDIHRAYMHVIKEWISYLKHLKKDYPYLFSVAERTNPFNPEADIIIRG
ncbi:MAG: hypothetical protein JW927_21450 [Deltaproteobacteria bacterium]|nr:hypothetical protein [Deltaproteobacteria bacterium]